MSAGIVGRRARPHRRRVRASGADVRPTPVNVLSVAAGGPFLTVTFDQSVILRGVPQWGFGTPASYPTGATLESAAVLRLTYSGSVESGEAPAVPFEDPAVRNSRGGFVVQRFPAVTQSAAKSAESDREPLTMPPMARAA